MEMMPITPERKAQLEDYAQRHGQDAPTALDEVLADYYAHERQQHGGTIPTLPGHEDVPVADVKPAGEFYAAGLNPAEWMQEYRAWTQSHAGNTVPMLTNEDISRNSIYD